MHHPYHRSSPPGTPTLDRGVGELVAENPRLSRVFHRFAIDFCCQGGRTVRQACAEKALDANVVVDALAAVAAGPTPESPNPAQLPPTALADHIEAKHHRYLRDELPRLCALAAKVAKVHGRKQPNLFEVNATLAGLARELGEHMVKEERVLFPIVRTLAAGGEAPREVDGPIACMLHEHEDAGQALAKLRELTDGYRPPNGACESHKALYAGLEDLESDLHQHIHLENAVLFPAAERLATKG